MARVTCTGVGWRDLLDTLENRDVLFVAPGAQKADLVRRELGDVLSSVSVVTLDELAGEVADSSAPGIRRISLDTTEYVVKSTLEDHRKDLEYLPDCTGVSWDSRGSHPLPIADDQQPSRDRASGIRICLRSRRVEPKRKGFDTHRGRVLETDEVREDSVR